MLLLLFKIISPLAYLSAFVFFFLHFNSRRKVYLHIARVLDYTAVIVHICFVLILSLYNTHLPLAGPFQALTSFMLIFAILNIQHPEKKLLDAPERSTDTRVAEKVSIDATTHSRKKDLQGAKPVVEETTAAEPTEKREIIQLALLLKTEELRQSYAPSAAIEDEPIPERSVESRRAAKSAAPSTARKKEAWREEKRGMGSATKEQDTLESPLDDVRVYSDKVVSRVKALIGETSGRIISVEYEKQSGGPKFIQLEIPVQHYKSFLAELAKISILQEPPPPILEKDKDWVQVRIRFITPK